MKRLIDRRTFVQQVGIAGAAWAALPAGTQPASAAEQPPLVTLALVGCAHVHTEGFVDALKARKDVKVKYVWDPKDAPRADRYAQALHAAVVPSDETVWSDAEVQAAVICSQTNLHHRLVVAGAKAGKHLFVEKPMGMSAADCREMVQAIEQAGVRFTTGYAMRTRPEYLFLKEQIALGNLGQITRIRASCCHRASLGGWFDKAFRWMADPKIAGCGAFGDMGTHGLDLLMWLLGDVDAVTADIKVVTGRYGDCDESGEALIRFRNGATGTLAAGWVDLVNPVSFLVSGTKGHATVFQDALYFMSEKVPSADGKTPWTKLPAALPIPLDMLVSTVGGKTGLPLVSPREAASRVGVMEAMYRASAERKWVAPA